MIKAGMIKNAMKGVVSLFTEGKQYETPPLNYSVPPSFAAHLPWVDVDEEGIIHLEDGRSAGLCFHVKAGVAEDKRQKQLEKIIRHVTNTFETIGKDCPDNPWIIQLFARDVDNFGDVVEQLHHQARVNDEFTQAVLNEDAKHFSYIGREQGIFSVDGHAWRGRERQVMLFVYRWLPDSSSKAVVDKNIKQLLSLQTRMMLPSSFADKGIHLSIAKGEGLFNFLAPFFNPTPLKGESHQYRGSFSEIDRDFSERLLRNGVKADPQAGVWWFEGQKRVANRLVELDTWDNEDFLSGCIFAEVKEDSEDAEQDSRSVVFDALPPGTLFSMTLFPQTKDEGRARLKTIQQAAVGNEPEVMECKAQCSAIDTLINKHPLWRGKIAFYLQADSIDELDSYTDLLRSSFNVEGLQLKFVAAEHQVAPLDSFFRYLPMNYQPQRDPHYWYCGWVWLSDMLRMSPLLGRSTGTGSQAFTYFNRGGEILGFDPLNDHLSNAHLTLFGPSGSGKSAMLVGMVLRLLALHRPRMFIIEAGNSFGLLGDFCERHGLTVNKVTLKPGCGTTLAPFADAKYIVDMDIPQITSDEALKPEHLNDNDEAGDEERDILGELEILARLMITGGEKRELDDYRRADSSMVRQALKNAAKACRQTGEQVRPIHIKEALQAFSQDDTRPEQRRLRANTMADSLGFFCEGMEGKIFNSVGEPWVEADVTIIDLGLYAKNGYEAQMAAAYISLINRINDIAERDQYSGRHIVTLTDEAHLISTNELLAPYATKIVKMWRKLNAWFWLATQDVADFPNSAKKMLNNSEWWILLNMAEDEINNLKAFKKLSPEQENLIRSMTSAKYKFKEGVVMGMDDTFLARFRNVTPALYLALGETDGAAKKIRADFMKAHQCSELDAALMKANDIEQGRANYTGKGL